MGANQIKVVCYGEVLWDVYPDKTRMGGAPFNVAAHLLQLGCTSEIISSVGKDEAGERILTGVRNHGLNTSGIAIDTEHPTGKVLVDLDSNGIPNYEIVMPVSWDYIRYVDEMEDVVRSANALVFGSLCARSPVSRSTLFRLLPIAPYCVLDLNIRQSFYDPDLIKQLLRYADLLKINDEEKALLISLFDCSELNFYDWLSKEFALETIITTKGADGAEVYNNEQLISVPGTPVEVVDTVGSGDAFLAAYLYHQLHGEGVAESLKKGCELGAFVATKSGAIPKHEL